MELFALWLKETTTCNHCVVYVYLWRLSDCCYPLYSVIEDNSLDSPDVVHSEGRPAGKVYQPESRYKHSQFFARFHREPAAEWLLPPYAREDQTPLASVAQLNRKEPTDNRAMDVSMRLMNKWGPHRAMNVSMRLMNKWGPLMELEKKLHHAENKALA